MTRPNRDPSPGNAQRRQLRCPRCDHVVVTVPPGYQFEDDELVCPGCGASVEPPQGGVTDTLKRIWDKAMGGRR